MRFLRLAVGAGTRRWLLGREIHYSEGLNMTKPKDIRQTKRGTIPYFAGEYLYKNGPQTPAALFAAVDFGPKVYQKEEALQCALRSGWLSECLDGKIACSQAARDHYDAVSGKVKVKYVGQIAATREPINVFARPPLSKRYIPNPRGLRQDIPAWSIRESASFKSLAGGEA